MTQPAPESKSATAPRRRGRRFTQAAALVRAELRGAGAKRGFTESRLLTRWAEICGPDLAALARPVRVSYARDGMGATLILACAGARATEVQMQAEAIRARVNACYGYNAISRVRLAQEDDAGFAERQAAFAGPRDGAGAPAPDPAAARDAEELAAAVADPRLRDALTRLGAAVLSRPRR